MKNENNEVSSENNHDSDRISAALSIWPAIARHHLRVGVGLAWDAAQQCHVERDGVVVYDTSEDEEK